MMMIIKITYLLTYVDRPVDRCLVTLSGPPRSNRTRNLGRLPGQRYTPHQQCQLIYGQQSYYCGVSIASSRLLSANGVIRSVSLNVTFPARHYA